MSRKTIITLIVAAILIELWFVLGEVENGSMLDEAEIIYRQVWPFLRWLLLLIVLPAILIRLLAKADVICIRRLDIRNFTNLTREPVLNEQNAVRLLYKAMAPTPGNGRFGRTISSGFAESKRPSITISTGVATISLSAVLGYLRQLILGPDIRLYGMLSKHDGAVHIRAWTDEGDEFKNKATAESDADALIIAITDLAQDLMRDLLNLHDEVAERYTAQRRFEKAGTTLDMSPTLTRNLELQSAWNTLEAHEYSAALDIFQRLADDRRSRVCKIFSKILMAMGLRVRCLSTEAKLGLAKSLASLRMLDVAEEACQSVKRFDIDGSVHMSLADIQSYSGKLTDAISNYDRAEVLLKRRIAGFPWRRSFTDNVTLLQYAAERLSQVSMGNRIEIINALVQLAQLYTSRGRLRMTLLSDHHSDDTVSLVRDDLEDAIELYSGLSNMMPDESNYYLEHGGRLEDLNELKDAVSMYAFCIVKCEEVIADDPYTYAARVDKAWAYVGMSSCYSKVLNSAYAESGSEGEKTRLISQSLAQLANFVVPGNGAAWLDELKKIGSLEARDRDKELENFVNRSITSLGKTGETVEADTDRKLLAEQFASDIAAVIPQEIKDKHDVSSPVSAMRLLLDATRSTASTQNPYDVFDNAKNEIGNNYVNSKAYAIFMDFLEEQELHLIAEGYYGLACLHAIELDYDTATGYLSVVTVDLGLTGFFNRATFDPDLMAFQKGLFESVAK